MFDVATILTCSGCFLGHPRPRPTGAGGTKAAFVKGISTGGTSAEDVFGSTCIGVGLFGTNCWLSMK